MSDEEKVMRKNKLLFSSSLPYTTIFTFGSTI